VSRRIAVTYFSTVVVVIVIVKIEGSNGRLSLLVLLVRGNQKTVVQ